MLNFGRTTFIKMNIQHLQLINISPFTNKISPFFNFNSIQMKFFTGKTETGWKFTTPTMKRKSIKPIFPPPGENLVIPGKLYIKYLLKTDWSPKIFCERIGGDCHEVADKFENINEIFTLASV
jgi:hypothetical protein